MKIIDAHCDALSKLIRDEGLSFHVPNNKMESQFEYMKKVNMAAQIFAVFVPPGIPSNQRFYTALKMVEKFHSDVVKKDSLIPILSARDLEKVCAEKADIRGGILSLEGADALEGNLLYLTILYRLGLRALGFTWNFRNEAADGVEEPQAGGLSVFGKQVLHKANELGIMLDVSHLSEKGFWNVVEESKDPFIASHSNCQHVYFDKRNLSNEQLKAIFTKGGVVGLTFIPAFITNKKDVNVIHFLKHVDHVLALGGENHLAFGSDFDGMDYTMDDLINGERYIILIEALLKQYKEEQVKKWLHGNWMRVFSAVLKEESETGN
ncbi:dipeptidase [Domibacillus sp. A3M-37]|uniref:dipeptidase n=1 Tax=Domibacillus sp. A3M-37 TaxID=2962037 RepID=UPI0020B8D7A5|nr:dipeptidase [Domibacillus sp. A3M-37]MCP3764667.1 dipeptidase [Domibacillus sp. A3M-37]